MTPETLALAARIESTNEKVDSNHADLKEDLREISRELRGGLTRINTTLTDHNGRLRKVEEAQIRKDTRAEVQAENADRFAKYKVPIITSVISASLTMAITAILTGGPV